MSAATSRADSPLRRALSWGIVTSLSALVGGLLRSKITAQVLGPAGFGVAAQLQQYVALATTGLSTFHGPALVRELARDKERGLPRGHALSVAFAWLVLASLVASAGLFAWVFIAHEHPGRAHLLVLGLGLAAAFATALLAQLGQVAVTENQVKLASLTNVTMSLASALVGALFVWLWTLNGLFLSNVVAPLIGLALAAVLLHRQGLLPLDGLRPRLEWSFLREALELGGASILGGVFAQSALTSMRETIDANGGQVLNGQFQASWSIGALYIQVLFSGIGAFVFPRFASATVAQLDEEIDNAARTVWRLAPPVVLFALALSGPLLRLFYDDRFLVAATMFEVQIAGDVAKATAWLVAGPLLYRGHSRPFVFLEALASGALALGGKLLIPSFGLRGAGFAYVLAYALYLPAAWLVFRVVVKGALSVRIVVLPLAFGAFTLALVWGANAFPLARWGLPLVALVWFFVGGGVDEVKLLLQARAQRKA